MNACKKGKAGELEAAHYLTELFGRPCSRGAQHAGGVESPDIKGIPGLHFEVKRVQSLNLGAAMAQAERDAGGALVPVVFHRRNREGWRMTIRADDLPAFVERCARAAAWGVQAGKGARLASKPGAEPSKTPDASCAKSDALALDSGAPSGHSLPSVNPGT